MRTFFFTYRVAATNHYGELFIRTNLMRLTRHELKKAVEELHGKNVEFNVLSLSESTAHAFTVATIIKWSDTIKKVGMVDLIDGSYMILFG